MKRVLIISQHFYPEIGSHANRIKNIYMLLKRENFDVTIFTSEPSYPNKNIYQKSDFWDEDSLNSEDNNIHRISINNRKYSNSIMNRLFYYLEIALKLILLIIKDKNKYDFVFATSPPIFTGFVGLFAKYKYRTKLIMDIRDLWPESLKGVGVFSNGFILNFFGLLEKMLYKKSDKIVINSLGFQEYIQKKAGITETKIVFIPNGSVKEELTTIKKERLGPRKIIYAGNLGLAQNTELINQLVPLFEAQGIQLTIIGYGVHKNHLINSVKNHKNVTIINPLTKKECFKIISEHDLGLVTLKDEEVFKTVLPGKIIDYMTCGVPIVGIVDGYAKELINNEGIGIAIHENDPQLILSWIMRLLNDEQRRNKMQIKSQQLILEKFNWEINIKKLVEYMQL
ncbi:glycosyltransferase family 4 protein [Neobacillus drentensis]|uniref:glycosyltransferase family 4 protein n=1 Tax=Neobacillus drentensis TaxID=220684 RepID=UPI002FFFC4A4